MKLAAKRWALAFVLPTVASKFDGVVPPLAFCVAAVAIGYAVQLANGAYTPEAITYVSAGLAATLIGVSAGRMGATRRWTAAAAWALAVGSAFELALVTGTLPGIYLRTPFWAEPKVRFALALAAILVGISAAGGRGARRVAIPLLGGIHCLLAIWTIGASPQPRIDVYAWHVEAFRAIAAHLDPYAIAMPNIYGSTQWYGRGLATPTRVLVGYPYPPFSLVLGWLGNFLGDYRFTNVAASTAAGLLMAYSRSGPIAVVAAAIFWFSPRLLFVLEQGWTEPQVIALFALTVFSACRAPRLLPMALGLLLSSKQYAIFLLPLVFMLQARPTVKAYFKLLGQAALIAAVLTVPWALWHPQAFFESVVAFQSKQPFRPDALSYLAWSASGDKPRLPPTMSFVMLLPATMIGWMRAPRTPSGFAGAGALILLAFFAFAKQAFCNYYMLIIGALCCAAASALLRPRHCTGVAEN